jgi:hypothetical protein
VCSHEDTQYELDTQDMRIVTMQPHPPTLVPQTLRANPYSRLGNMDRGTTSEDADMELQLPIHEAGGDVGDSQDLSPPDSQEVPLPDSHKVPLSESKDIQHPEDLVLLVLKEDELWTICMFECIYLCIFMSNLNTIYIH